MPSTWNYREFNPKKSSTDKSQREAAVDRMAKLVETNHNKLALASAAVVAEIDKNRSIRGIKFIAPPKSALDKIFSDKNFRLKVQKAVEETQMEICEKWDCLEDEGLDEYLKKYGDDDKAVEETNGPPVPEYPILWRDLTSVQIQKYFTVLLKYCYNKEGITKPKLWHKVDRDGTILSRPTKLHLWSEQLEEFLPRKSYTGSGSGGPGIGNRLAVASAVLLSKLGVDPNDHCVERPPNYCDHDIDENNLVVLNKENNVRKQSSSSRVAKAMKSANNSSHRKRKASSIEVDEVFEEDEGAGFQEIQPILHPSQQLLPPVAEESEESGEGEDGDNVGGIQAADLIANLRAGASQDMSTPERVSENGDDDHLFQGRTGGLELSGNNYPCIISVVQYYFCIR